MSAKNLTLPIFIDASDLQTEIERLKKMSRPKCRLYFRFLWKGLNCTIKKVHSWQRHELEVKIG